MLVHDINVIQFCCFLLSLSLLTVLVSMSVHFVFHMLYRIKITELELELELPIFTDGVGLVGVQIPQWYKFGLRFRLNLHQSRRLRGGQPPPIFYVEGMELPISLPNFRNIQVSAYDLHTCTPIL